MYVYNKKFITKIRDYLNEDYGNAIFVSKIKNVLIGYRYKFSIKKIVPYQKTKPPYYILIIRLIFNNVEIVKEDFRLYPYSYSSMTSNLIRRRYFNDIIRHTLFGEIKNMFGEELQIKTSFSNEKIFDLFKK